MDRPVHIGDERDPLLRGSLELRLQFRQVFGIAVLGEVGCEASDQTVERGLGLTVELLPLDPCLLIGSVSLEQGSTVLSQAFLMLQQVECVLPSERLRLVLARRRGFNIARHAQREQEDNERAKCCGSVHGLMPIAKPHRPTFR